MSANYYQHLASRDWGLTKRAVMLRSGGMCERCHIDRATQVHHFTYERVGREEMDDLAAVCKSCHEFVSGRTDKDPVSAFFNGAHSGEQRPQTYSWLFTQCKTFKELKELWNYLECPVGCEGCAAQEAMMAEDIQ